jgi:hypothetical protein
MTTAQARGPGVFDAVKRLLIGRARRSEALGDTLLPKWLALPVFASAPDLLGRVCH